MARKVLGEFEAVTAKEWDMKKAIKFEGCDDYMAFKMETAFEPPMFRIDKANPFSSWVTYFKEQGLTAQRIKVVIMEV